ncbi:uncharacterized protein LOC117943104 [Etheostoma cragini]|uniref:uncharacterized protein LOC117943104 n=1 Tax=Etheostoma cragini TaxID=417921 RepID=UPI00155E5473|nr:uncharacterized protein LOC117943104 [Etheostoma cragini]
MGQAPSYSGEEYHSYYFSLYSSALRNQQCLLPDVGIDESLLRYSGTDSNAVLQAFSTEMLNSVPGYVGRLGSILGSKTPIPNAVGLGALVISLIIEIAIKSSSRPRDNTYSLLRRVFGEEKASSVQDTMSEVLERHDMFKDNNQRLREEMRRLEQQLSYHLTILRSSLVRDGQMSSRGFKIWVNGAAFHVQLLIHEARLNIQTGRPASEYLNPINTAIDSHMRTLDSLLQEYKTFKINSKMFTYQPPVNLVYAATPSICTMANNEVQNCQVHFENNYNPCGHPGMNSAYMDIVYSNYEPITGLKSYFLNVKNNVNSLIHQRGTFTVPSAAG